VENETTLTAVPAQPTPAPALQPFAAWFARLGLSGKIAGIAAVVGMLGTFLPGITISMEMPALKEAKKAAPSLNLSSSKSTMVLDDWRGTVELLGFMGALALLYVLYPPNGLERKPLCWIGVGTGALVTVLALWLLVAVLRVGSGIDMGFMGSVKYSPGIGAFVTLLAGLALTVGAFLKAREEKLI
jgi:hypothetical protein